MNKCPHCGQWEVIWMSHDPETGEPATDDNDASHQYCRNCDNGVCQFC